MELEGFLPEVNDETDLDENHVDDDDNEDIQSELSSSPIPGYFQRLFKLF